MTDAGVDIGLVRGSEELEAILELQRQNLAASVSAEEAREQGFVTVVHTLPVLTAMHERMPSVVARRAGVLVGYALAMPEEARAWIPVLVPMFETLVGLSFRGKPLARSRFYVMGQICVAREARGQGVFDALYEGHHKAYAERFDCVVTEVATRNTRSMRAHERVGFEVVHRYRDATDEWAVIAWDFGHLRAH